MNLDAMQEKIKNAHNEISNDSLDELAQQASVTAANMFVMFDKAALSPAGFVTAVVRSYEAAITWALAEGYITLTDKAQASDEEKAQRAAKAAERADAKDRMGGNTLAGVPAAAAGAYL